MTDAPAIQIAAMTMDEFIRRYDQAGPFELIDGEIVPKMPNISIHAKTIKRIFRLFLPYEEQGLGEVFQETTFVLTDSPEWVKGSRIPDVMFVSQARVTAFESEIPDWESKPYIFIPDLVVEVVSSNDSYSEINAKVKRYLADGVRMVWVVDPQTREVAVHMLGSNQHTTLSGDALLTAGDILPGFALKVSELFG